ncbi:MAG: GH3 auxin-responsive promoter family protein, partial [Chitinophagaceae bacterium]|nr:GH3 auxin-responsive promoter family protein [Chitinophagaceae bacterium]
PYIEKMLEGEQNILWHSPITWFAKSSGTTSEKSKFIPVSTESLDDGHFKSSKDVLALYYRNFPQSTIFSGKSLVLGGSHQINQLNKDSFYGDLSAVMLQNMSLIPTLISTPDLSIALMEEWDEKIEKMAEATMQEDVTFIAGVPTWTIVLINKILEKTGKTDLHDVWPNLELYIHGGVNFTPYQQQFQRFFASKSINYLETYNASEGFFAAQDVIGRDGMLLFLDHGIFYEFMPLDEDGKEFPNTLLLNEVIIGVNYALIITTNSGLWRYKIGDTIAFVSTNPYRIKVTGRLKHFINAFGEEVIIENADMAITKAASQFGVNVKDYTVAPIYFGDASNGTHQWLIECDINDADKKDFIIALDENLKTLNSDYEAKRFKDMAMRLPEIIFVPQNTFYNWLKSKGKLGGQHKVPRLSNDRKIIEEVLAVI